MSRRPCRESYREHAVLVHAEAEALKLALSLVATNNWRKLFVLSDSLNAVEALNDQEEAPLEAESLVGVTKCLAPFS